MTDCRVTCPFIPRKVVFEWNQNPFLLLEFRNSTRNKIIHQNVRKKKEREGQGEREMGEEGEKEMGEGKGKVEVERGRGKGK